MSVWLFHPCSLAVFDCRMDDLPHLVLHKPVTDLLSGAVSVCGSHESRGCGRGSQDSRGSQTSHQSRPYTTVESTPSTGHYETFRDLHWGFLDFSRPNVIPWHLRTRRDLSSRTRRTLSSGDLTWTPLNLSNSQTTKNSSSHNNNNIKKGSLNITIRGNITYIPLVLGGRLETTVYNLLYNILL